MLAARSHGGTAPNLTNSAGLSTSRGDHIPPRRQTGGNPESAVPGKGKKQGSNQPAFTFGGVKAAKTDVKGAGLTWSAQMGTGVAAGASHF